LLSTVTWNNASGGDWDTPSNWSTGVLPGPSDDVVINQSGITVTHNTSASDTVDSVSCAANLNVSSGSLAINTTSSAQPTSTVSEQFNLSGASLQLLAGSLSLIGGGTVSGSVTGAAGTTLEFDGPTTHPSISAQAG
jgi:hypothetical protein